MGVRLLIFIVVAGCLAFECEAQIKARTLDGKKVLLNLDGTWKYETEELEKDTTLLKNLAMTADSSALKRIPTVTDSLSLMNLAMTKDSIPVVVPPPKPKRPPPNLDCSALVDVQRSGDKFVAVSKKLVIASEDMKSGFTISFSRTRIGPLIWNTSVIGGGWCLDQGSKLLVSLKDGSNFQLENEADTNCNGNFRLYFGADKGKEYSLEIFKKTEIVGIKILTPKRYEERPFMEEDAAIFKAGLNCILNIK